VNQLSSFLTGIAGPMAQGSSFSDNLGQMLALLTSIDERLALLAEAEATTGDSDDEGIDPINFSDTFTGIAPVTFRCEQIILTATAVIASVIVQVGNNLAIGPFSMNGNTVIPINCGSRGFSIQRGAQLSLAVSSNHATATMFGRRVANEEVDGVRNYGGSITSRVRAAR
jgi:hypothetical protein